MGALHVGPEVFHGVRHPALVFSSYLVRGLLFALVGLLFGFRSFALALVVASFRRLHVTSVPSWCPLGVEASTVSGSCCGLLYARVLELMVRHWISRRVQFLGRLKPMTSETFGDAHPVVAGVVSPSTASSMNWHSFLGRNPSHILSCFRISMKTRLFQTFEHLG